jgi:hypothetical protein
MYNGPGYIGIVSFDVAIYTAGEIIEFCASAFIAC